MLLEDTIWFNWHQLASSLVPIHFKLKGLKFHFLSFTFRAQLTKDQQTTMKISTKMMTKTVMKTVMMKWKTMMKMTWTMIEVKAEAEKTVQRP